MVFLLTTGSVSDLEEKRDIQESKYKGSTWKKGRRTGWLLKEKKEPDNLIKEPALKQNKFLPYRSWAPKAASNNGHVQRKLSKKIRNILFHNNEQPTWFSKNTHHPHDNIIFQYNQQRTLFKKLIPAHPHNNIICLCVRQQQRTLDSTEEHPLRVEKTTNVNNTPQRPPKNILGVCTQQRTLASTEEHPTSPIRTTIIIIIHDNISLEQLKNAKTHGRFLSRWLIHVSLFYLFKLFQACPHEASGGTTGRSSSTNPEAWIECHFLTLGTPRLAWCHSNKTKMNVTAYRSFLESRKLSCM